MACCGKSRAVVKRTSGSSYTLPLPKNSAALNQPRRNKMNICPICGEVEHVVVKKVRGKTTKLIKCGCPHLKRFHN